MKKILLLIIATAFGLVAARAEISAANTLSPTEVQQGWRLLWDGKSSTGWTSAKAPTFPATGWEIKEGVWSVVPSGGHEGGNGASGGDIITLEKFSNFELSVDFKIAPGTNSGIKYFVDVGLNKGEGSAIGLEYQILDDERHPDAKLGRNGNRTIGSLYDLIPAAKDKPVNPIGQWNTARIVVRGDHVEHWLNGRKIVEYTRFTPEFKKLVEESKYHIWPHFGELKEGPILLQDHGDAVSFRNIKIRVLTP